MCCGGHVWSSLYPLFRWRLFYSNWGCIKNPMIVGNQRPLTSYWMATIWMGLNFKPRCSCDAHRWVLCVLARGAMGFGCLVDDHREIYDLHFRKWIVETQSPELIVDNSGYTAIIMWIIVDIFQLLWVKIPIYSRCIWPRKAAAK